MTVATWIVRKEITEGFQRGAYGGEGKGAKEETNIGVNNSSLSRDLESDGSESSSETLEDLAHDDLELTKTR